MNKQGPDKIEWTDYTWNPVTGCNRGCWYCYARKIDRRFKRNPAPAFHPKLLDQPLHRRRTSRIFVCSTADLFGDGVQDQWIEQVLAACAAAPQHVYQFLTKEIASRPYERWLGLLPPNAWLGYTATDQASWNAAREAHARFAEATRVPLGLGRVLRENRQTFISLEPLLGPINPCRPFKNASGCNLVIIGAYTGPGAAAYAPNPRWVKRVLQWAKPAWGGTATRQRNQRCKVFLKANLGWPTPLCEFPADVTERGKMIEAIMFRPSALFEALVGINAVRSTDAAPRGADAEVEDLGLS